MKVEKYHNTKIFIKEGAEIEAMRTSGKILGMILFELEKLIVPGITTLELDKEAHKMMIAHKVKPSFLGFCGFPGVLCSSINEQVVHGIPGNYKIKDGDIVTIDCGVIYNDFHSDSAITKAVGTVPSTTIDFLNTAELALSKAIQTARAGIRIHDISSVIQDTVEAKGYGVVRDLIGHGVGKQLHEEPPVPNFRDSDPGPVLKPGMTIAVEPIITMGDYEIKTLKDGWTCVTADGSLATQVEHTLLITEKGCEILTQRPKN